MQAWVVYVDVMCRLSCVCIPMCQYLHTHAAVPVYTCSTLSLQMYIIHACVIIAQLTTNIGVPIFFANLAIAGWIKFHFDVATAVGITVVMGTALAYFVFSQFRWVSHILEKNMVCVVVVLISESECSCVSWWHVSQANAQCILCTLLCALQGPLPTPQHPTHRTLKLLTPALSANFHLTGICHHRHSNDVAPISAMHHTACKAKRQTNRQEMQWGLERACLRHSKHLPMCHHWMD